MKNTDDPSQLQPLVTEPRMAEDAIEPNVTEPTPEICHTCRFYSQWPNNDDFGYCRRYAPKPLTVEPEVKDVRGDVVWPSVYYDEWCGEFQVRLKDTKQV